MISELSFNFLFQLSSKCDNRLFRIRFDIPKLGRHPFLEALSLPIRCISRSKTSRTTSLTWRKTSNRNYYINRCDSSNLDDGSMEHIPNIVREAKPSPSSKRIKLGNNVPIAVFQDELKQANKGHDSIAWTSNEVVFHLWLLFRHLYLAYRTHINYVLPLLYKLFTAYDLFLLFYH